MSLPDIWENYLLFTGDQYNDFLAIGRLISKDSFKREKKELRIGSNIIDVIKNKDGFITLIETKKSSKVLEASKFQLLFYMYNLRNKTKNIRGEIRIPKEKKVIVVELNDESIKRVEKIKKELISLMEDSDSPQPEKTGICKKCSYNEFCWS